MPNPNYPKNLEIQMSVLREQGKNLLKQISEMRQPLGHGLTSTELTAILDSKGLGEKLSRNAYSNTKNITDLKKPDGLLAAYLFARLDKTAELEITSDSIEGLDAISRYIKLNPVSEGRLRNSFKVYIEKRKPTGFPVLLIYDGGNEVECKNSNDAHPSEMEYEGIIENSKLKSVLVPQKRTQEVKSLLEERRMAVEVLPAEILEVLELS